MQVFEERGKPECPGENLLEQRREPTKFNSRMTPSRTTSNIEPGPNWWEATALTTTPLCGQGFALCGLSVLGLYSALRGLSQGTPVFPSQKKPKFDFSCSICIGNHMIWSAIWNE